ASSAAIYGDVGVSAAHEDLVPAPQTAYGVDKLGSELHARVATLVHNVPAMGFRFFNVYGPRQDPSSPYGGVISIFARLIGAGKPITLHGDGGQTRDFVHVSDVVAHLQTGMHTLAVPLTGSTVLPGVLNVCTRRSVTIRMLAEQLSLLLGVPLRASYGPTRSGDIRHSQGSPDATVRHLGLQATIRLEQGLRTLRAFLA
ncbi:NAD-dependent epimerase/dehydratase family protein, partial [Acidisphaera sp. L21]|uniref:NAD-dependent epimerase/dehydratase family protein n=1 Tax=Acidisphaera sp. L21 TaxID=1641851 RepID=UPI001C204772